MDPKGYAQKRNFVYLEWIALIVILVAVLSNGQNAIACMSWQKCLTISECRKAQRENKLPPSALMNFASSFLYPCDDSSQRKICCTIKSPGEPDNEDPGYTITYGESQEPSEDVLVALPLTDSKPNTSTKENCGYFIKGNHEEDAAPGQFPWLSLLGYIDKNSGDIQFHCGGSLINDRYILTSPYCIEKMASPPEIVRLGVYDRSSEKDCANENVNTCVQDYGVEEIITHKSYNYPLLKNDIALVRLSKPVPKFTENIRPICLPTEPLDSEIYALAGWGITKQNSTATPKFGPITLPDRKGCGDRLEIPLNPLAESQLCGHSKIACFGDGGGPLIGYMTKGNTEIAVQVGIFSYGGNNCKFDLNADLYTNVASFMDWINENTKE